MLYRFLTLTILSLTAIAAWGQTPQNITLQQGGKPGSLTESMACADQYAGTVTLLDDQGAIITDDTIYLCFNETMQVQHNGDANLTGDPVPGTTPGIKYGFFNCPPTISGPNLTSILTNPCIINIPPPAQGIWVTAGGSFGGNITFNNSGTLQNFFNGGNPVLIWFAPITIDFFNNNQFENHPVTGESGPCVNVNVNAAFPVVYLNQIKFANFDNAAGVSGCQGTFNVTGGLPEFDGTNYNFNIHLAGNPNVQAEIVGGPYSHGNLVTFKVPTPGIYTVNVGDSKGCVNSFLADMSTCVNVSQSVQSGSVVPGDNICLNVTNLGGFIDIISMQYALTWDPTILQFTNVTNLTPLLPGFTPANSFNSLGDSLIFSWGSLSGVGVGLPDGTVIYQVCFDIIGNDGECTDITYINPPGPGIEVVNEMGNLLGFNGSTGEVCVSASALVVSFTQDSVSCSGASDGSFTVTVSGGQAPYNVMWQNAGGGPVQGPGTINVNGGNFTVPNLAAGTYNVTITDNQGVPLVSTKQVKVLTPPILSILFIENPPNCNGLTGSISASLVLDSVLVVNPTTKYTFKWSTNAATTTISNISSGAYSLTVTNISTGCTVVNGTFLPQPPALDVMITVDSSTCSGIGDGGLHVVVAGGTPDINGDYTIQWPTIGPAPGLIIQNTISNVNGVASNSYPLWVTDANGCVFEADIWLPAKKILSVNAVVQNVNCMNECAGSIFISGTTTSSTGQPAGLPYNFAWFGTPPPPPPTGNTPTTTNLTGLCVGIYTLVMEDAAGCEIDTTFEITAPPPLNVTLVNAKNETCQPGNDGSITVAVTGGNYPYTYTWTNAVATDSTATGLMAGAYMIIVSDVNACKDTLSANITAPAPPVIQSFNNSAMSCASSTDGILSVTATPGSAPIANYAWSSGASGPNTTSVSGLSPGTYYVTVTDANGCNVVDTAQVTAPFPLMIDNIQTSPPQCPGLSGGSIVLFVSGGTGPYFFSWSNGIMGTGFNVNGGISAGNYSVTVIDANGCAPLMANVTLNDPPSITASFSAIDSVSCANTGGPNCNGTATATAMYSNGNSGMFNFTWLSGETSNGVTSSTAVKLCKGVQTVIISDNTCFDTFSVVIPSPLPISPGQTITNVSCNGLSDGSVTLIPGGGTPPYTIIWMGGQTGPTISGLTSGKYTALITDSKMCSFSHEITINQPDPLDVFLNANGTSNVACPGDENGIITVQVQGGNLNLGAPAYFWSNGVAPTNSNVAQGLAPGTYSVTVVDTKGCRDSLTNTITQPPPIQFALGQITPIPCFGGNTFITVDSVWGGNLAAYQFSVDNGINRLPGSPSPVFAGEHLITIVDVVNGCTKDTTIDIGQPLELSVQLPQVIEIELGDSLTKLDPTIISSLPIDTFIWTPADQLSCADCKNPRVTAIKSQLYTLTIIDANGCSASARILVDVDRNRNVFIPNVFSPNDDGINDKFQVFTGIGVTRINFLRLYDRWGEKMYEELDLPPSPDGTVGWDGKFKGEKMKPAVFLYLIEVEFIDGQVLLYRGDVTLLR